MNIGLRDRLSTIKPNKRPAKATVNIRALINTPISNGRKESLGKMIFDIATIVSKIPETENVMKASAKKIGKFFFNNFRVAFRLDVEAVQFLFPSGWLLSLDSEGGCVKNYQCLIVLLLIKERIRYFLGNITTLKKETITKITISSIF
jgi:hypothetical protein